MESEWADVLSETLLLQLPVQMAIAVSEWGARWPGAMLWIEQQQVATSRGADRPKALGTVWALS